ncbi:MAG: phenylalanine--tRNA ligase subunit beta [Nitrospirales bacterium]
MPTISITRKDLEQLLGRAVSLKQLDAWLPWVKGEFKGVDAATGAWRIELQDSNRPDLWCCEGLARQIRAKLEGRAGSYPFFKPGKGLTRRIEVAAGLEPVRPYVAACAARGAPMSADALAQFIQTQEKLADIYGRKRRTVSIGLYRLAPIKFPVAYTLVRPDEVRFTPLGFEEPLSLGEILTRHPKGQEYGPILSGHERLPLLRDHAGQVLSFPPIINSRDIGEVQVHDRDLLIEVTGTDVFMVVLTLNIFAVNLADRGASIEPVEIVYPYATPLGKRFATPLDFGKPKATPLKAIEAALGETLPPRDIQEALVSYGHTVTLSRGKVSVKPPPYRQDLMHAVDVVEDVAISRGYDRFAPIMPSQFTVGGLSRVEVLSDRMRDSMVGLGFQEIISNILVSRADLVDRMRLAGTERDHLVEVDNVMSQTYSCLRQWMLPSLLRVESGSSREFYPHRLFEVGEVAVLDVEAELGSRTLTVLGALIAHATANFSEAHTALDVLLYYLDCPYVLEPLPHPSFLEGRGGLILSQDRPIGFIGELHPEVLEQWEITMPAVAFELDLSALAER